MGMFPFLQDHTWVSQVGSMAVTLWNIHCQFLQTQYSTKQGGQAASRPARARALHTPAQDADVVHWLTQDWD